MGQRLKIRQGGMKIKSKVNRNGLLPTQLAANLGLIHAYNEASNEKIRM